MAASSSKSSKSSSKQGKGKGKATNKKSKPVASEDESVSSSSSAGDSASTYEQGSDDEDVVVLSGEEEEEEQDEEEAASESDLEEEQGSKKRKKGSPSKGAKSKDDRNTRVVKKIKTVDGPEEDPATAVILPTTLQFLKELVGHNDRAWFQENDARYRHALANFTHFISSFVPLGAEADYSLPHLPAKDLIQRIYRDVRFSKDKTPYKTHLSASHSRTGRKGPFALYYIQIGANNSSLLAAGYWQPGADALKKIRACILDDSAPLRKILNEPAFVKYFGAPDPKKGRTSVFGNEDQLKNAPKMEGVTKEHPEIDLLKLRSVAVSHRFSDKEVLDPDFLDKILLPVVEAVAPFVQLLNEMTFPSDFSEEEQEEEEEEGAAGSE